MGRSEPKPKAQAWVDLGRSEPIDPGICPLCGVQIVLRDDYDADHEDMSDPMEARIPGEPVRLRTVHSECGDRAGWVEA